MGDSPKILVYLWFDIEDYVTKDSDGLPLVAFNILKKYAVRATCKIVAEKLRRLKENSREDVISAISGYDVGYHLDTHSRHPTLYEYFANVDVLSGAKEFMARETEGLELFRQVFRRTPSCFGHPGPIWAPHVYPALQESGIPVYLDETSILNLNDQPYWYCGILNLNGAKRNFIVFDFSFQAPTGIKGLKKRFKAIHDRLRSKGGGAASILFHLHTAINRKFWDEVNFANGKNRTREQYEEPPRQPPEVTARAWKDFEELIRYISSFGDVQFITASDAVKIYHDSAKVVVSNAELEHVAQHFASSTSHLRIGDSYLSPAGAFYAVTKALAHHADEGALPGKIDVKEPLGPMAPARTKGSRKLKTGDFLASAKATLDSIESQRCLPTGIPVGDYAELAPHDYLATACRLLSLVISRKDLPESTRTIKGRPPQVNHVSGVNLTKACKWKVLPRNFKAPKILEQAKLQAWTLRPAVPTSSATIPS
jgi:hypothetical protein